jgi:hypothetical protein
MSKTVYKPENSLNDNVIALKKDYPDDVAIITELIGKTPSGGTQLSKKDIIAAIASNGYSSSNPDTAYDTANTAYDTATTLAATTPAETTTKYETEIKKKDTTVGQIEDKGGKCAVPDGTIFGGKSRKQKKRGGKRSSLKKSKKSNKYQKKSRKSRGKK